MNESTWSVLEMTAQGENQNTRSIGVTRLFGARGEQSQWLPLTETMNFKSITFIESPFIWFRNITFFESKKSIFLI
jgi:hypothetical protein